ncbi:TonB-dependent receptor [Arenibacter sp. GZD96]|uniref:SusC/RagA family TonB-linked outer membrane protein n=1 Tax=Aurantibrevibacter litoralis TaxID=3106030 RepID=UPI002AFEEF00|nr:TonB-dependent receptor [Arenibacter sp. GZD-96]MEA1787451.1 TonB-dependent receptor [Arenibacter sp. GZD-96]
MIQKCDYHLLKLKRWTLSFGIRSLAILICFGAQMALAKTDAANEKVTSAMLQSTITGTVTDQDGAPLPGANVLVRGTTNGTQTDFDGNYTINADSNATLVFSYVGFKSVTVAIAGRTTVNVSMEEDASQLSEVIVLGYASQTRGDLTGSVASVDLTEAVKVPIVNAAEALQGRVSGVTVVSQNAPGASPVVRIRGFGTGNNNNPLYVIDGVQTDDPSILNSINPGDIAQMNVLKDAAAAIYGARASNGVIIVTTKSGGYNMEKTSVEVDTYTGFSRATNLIDLLNAEEQGRVIWESLTNDGVALQHPQYGNGANPVVPSQLQNVPVSATVRPGGTDWLDAIFREAVTTSASVTVQNGTAKGKSLMSIGYLNRQGIQLATGFKRGTARFNSEYKVSDRIRIGQHINLSFSNTSGGVSQVQSALLMNPLIPVRDDEGLFAGTYNGAANLGNTRSPVAQLLRAENNFAKRLRVFGDVYAVVDIMDGLTFKTSVGGDIEAFNDRRFQALDPEHSEPLSVNTLFEQDQDRYEWVWNNTLNLNKTFGDHSINAVVGIEALKFESKGKQITRNDFLFETPEFYLLSNGAGVPNVSFAFDGATSLFSVFGTANYSYKSKYLLTATVRRDKSSRFLGDNQSDTFPSFSGGWVISQEDFFPQDALVSSLKVKGSWGQMGNQTLPANNPTINISSLGEQLANYSFNGAGAITTGAFLSQVGNPSLKWETSESINFGVDLGFFNDKLLISAEYFDIETKDLISRDNSLISTTAIDAQAPLVNLGSFTNKGFDFSIGYSNTTASGWTYGIQANISHYDNEVTELISDFQLGDGGFRGGAMTRTQVGQPLSSFFGRVVDGIFASEAEVASSPDQGFPSNAAGVGRFRYRDLNGDGAITDEDRAFIGSPHPDFTYGINLNVAYKGFDVSAFIQGSQGNDIYNYTKIFTDFPTFTNTNRSTRVLDAWRPDNLGASIPKLSQQITNNETQPNSYFVEDGSFMRLKNLQIGYALPDQIIEKMGLSLLRFYVQGTNLFTITPYDGFDPELGPRFGGDNLTIGVDDDVNGNQYPTAQIFTLGLNLKF